MPPYPSPVLKFHIGQFDPSKLYTKLKNKGEVYVVPRLSSVNLLILRFDGTYGTIGVFNDAVSINYKESEKYDFYYLSGAVYAYYENQLQSTGSTGTNFNKIELLNDITFSRFNGNPMPDFYIKMVDNVGD